MNHYTYRSMIVGKKPEEKPNMWAEAAIIIGMAALLVLLSFIAAHMWDIHSGEMRFYDGQVTSKIAHDDVTCIYLKTDAGEVVELNLKDRSDYYRIEIGGHYSFGVRGEHNNVFGWKPYICRIKQLEDRI